MTATATITRPLAPPAEVVAAVKAHAKKNYNKGGWYRIRALTDRELREMLAGTTTQMGAYRRAVKYIHQTEAQAAVAKEA